MKFSVQCFLGGVVVSWLVSFPASAQLVSDGATATLANVTNTFTGNVTVGTNGAFARSNEVQLLSASARWLMGNNLYIGSNGSFNRLVVSNGAFLNNNNGLLGNGAAGTSNS